MEICFKIYRILRYRLLQWTIPSVTVAICIVIGTYILVLSRTLNCRVLSLLQGVLTGEESIMCDGKQKLTSLVPHGDSAGANKLIMITDFKPNR